MRRTLLLAALVAAAPANNNDAPLEKRQGVTYASTCVTVVDALATNVVYSTVCKDATAAGFAYRQTCYGTAGNLVPGLLPTQCGSATPVSTCLTSTTSSATATNPGPLLGILGPSTTLYGTYTVQYACTTPTYPVKSTSVSTTSTTSSRPPTSTSASAAPTSTFVSSTSRLATTSTTSTVVPTTSSTSIVVPTTSSTSSTPAVVTSSTVIATSSKAPTTSILTSSSSSLVTTSSTPVTTSTSSVAALATSSVVPSSSSVVTTIQPSTTTSNAATTSSSPPAVSSSAPATTSTPATSSAAPVTSSPAQVLSTSSLVTTSSTRLTSSSVVPTTSSVVPSTSSVVPSTSSVVPTTSSVVPTTSSAVPTTSSAVPASSSAAPSSSRASAAPTAGLPRTAKNGATYIGCFQDGIDQRTLQQRVNDVNNVEECVVQCGNAGFDRAGLEYYTQCFCGYATAGYNGQPQIADSVCSVPCNDATETCGNGNALQVYAIPNALVNANPTASSTATPTAAPTAGLPRTSRNGGKYLGCYRDDVGQRTLPVRVQDVGTVEACITQCQSAGYTMAGIEYYYQCFCGSSGTNGQPQISDSECSAPCNDDKSETCGGGNAIQLYSVPSGGAAPSIPTTVTTSAGSGALQGCYSDNVNARTLPNRVADAGSVDQCVSSCINAGYSYAGIEYTRECYCGNSLTAPLIDNAQCQKYTCTENGSQKCGGDSAIQVYSLQNSKPPPAASGTWSSVGCLQDFYPNTRTLQGYSVTSNSMTPQVCMSTCQAKGFTYAGVEYSGECYCDSQIRNNPQTVSSCSMACSGDSSQTCGGSNAIQVYTLGAVPSGTGSSAAPSPTIQKTTSGGATYKGCYTDSVNARALRTRNPDVTGSDPIGACMASCKSAGFSLGAVEYGHECFCDQSINNGQTLTSDSACSQVCDGNSQQYCGNGNTAQVYTL
ncbi:hypothetical protein BCR37DRAFT_376149 [Protomyces lactucae-debilis]|uniref:WSC domain-containing protein n=1 Tax=Protomyces lactucae-debilis TaxID=2754530 RepID=A0A1Y2FS81_PROLT|nr:uncharacterized protein BCR37DRAFT_376149 [Protomyces lactucae-debilis]ORY86870.1 hypothetical protein BCR37DRAFT_376149 [Protomyces lactucae-debilis]